MAKYYIILFFLLSFFSSCSSNYLMACYENISAIYLSERGEMDRALTAFARASDNIANDKYKKYVEYNIAFLYSEIGELGAANRKLLSVDASNDDDLGYMINCELGRIAFKKGDFGQAALFFKNAALIDSNDIRLIQNLELALLLMKEDDKIKEESVNYILPGNRETEGARKLLDIMFAGESLFWVEETLSGKAEQGKDW